MRTYLEAENHEDNHDSSSKTSALVGRRSKTQEADDEQNQENGSQTDEVDGTASEARHDPPCNEASHETQAILADSKMERVVLAQTDALQELGAKTHKRNTTKSLGDERHGRNLCAVQIAAAEEMPVIASGTDLLLVLVCNNHHFYVGI